MLEDKGRWALSLTSDQLEKSMKAIEIFIRYKKILPFVFWCKIRYISKDVINITEQKSRSGENKCDPYFW